MPFFAKFFFFFCNTGSDFFRKNSEKKYDRNQLENNIEKCICRTLKNSRILSLN